MSIAPRYANCKAARYLLPGMKTVEEVRRMRLKMLKEEFGTLVALGTKLGMSARDSTLSQYLNASTGTKTNKPKEMGSAMARRLEQACGKEVGWMDTDAAPAWPFSTELWARLSALELDADERTQVERRLITELNHVEKMRHGAQRGADIEFGKESSDPVQRKASSVTR